MVAKAKKQSADSHEEIKWPFGMKNYIAFAIAMAVISLGYVSLGQGSITLAPALLVVGYCVLIPVALLIKGRPEEQESTSSEGSS